MAVPTDSQPEDSSNTGVGPAAVHVQRLADQFHTSGHLQPGLIFWFRGGAAIKDLSTCLNQCSATDCLSLWRLEPAKKTKSARQVYLFSDNPG